MKRRQVPRGKAAAKRAPRTARKAPSTPSRPAKPAPRAKTARTTSRPAAPPRLEAPTPQAVMASAFHLSRELSLEAREEELVGVFAETLRQLLPGRLLCLRVVDPRSLRLSALNVDGPLSAAARQELARAPLAFKRSALRQTRLPESVTATGRVVVGDRYQPLFDGAHGGFSVPLVAAGELFGLLNVEYPRDPELAAVDEPLVIPLANQLSVALRNLQLLGETRYYRDYLRRVIDVAPALIIVVDRGGRVTVANAALERYAALACAPVGQHVAEAFGPGLATLLLDGLESAVGDLVEEREVVIPREGAAPGRAVFNVSLVRTPDGAVDGVLGIGQDVGQLRSLEHQVIQAEKLATLGQLAAGVVHELNNPLTSISVYGEYLLKLLERIQSGQAIVAPADLEKARRVTEGASRIQKLTRDLTSYARPSGDRELVQINEVVRQALGFCEHVTKRAEARVELVLSERLPRVWAIPAQLHQVLINLVTNACHALPAPDQLLRVATRLEVGDDGARCVVIEVQDSGVGIDEHDRARIFEPFYTTKKEGKGTGLGLSIVKNIIEGHGGRVGFESQVGAGTTFRITLPAAAESLPGAALAVVGALSAKES